MALGVLRFLPPPGYGLTVVTVQRPVRAGEKHFPADRASFRYALAENFRFKILSISILQQHPAKELAADGIGKRLRAGHFLTVIQVKAVAIITGTAQLANERDRPLPLSAGHARERPVRLPLNGRQQLKME